MDGEGPGDAEHHGNGNAEHHTAEQGEQQDEGGAVLNKHHGRAKGDRKKNGEHKLQYAGFPHELHAVLNHTYALSQKTEKKDGIGQVIGNTEGRRFLRELELEPYKANSQKHDDACKSKRGNIVEEQDEIMVLLRDKPVDERRHAYIFTTFDNKRNSEIGTPYQ